MSLHRFFVPPPQIKDDNVFIRGTDVWHITKVLRLSPGAEVIVFDGTGREYRVLLGKQKPRGIFGTVVERWERQVDSPLHLMLVQGIPKSNKMDLIVQKASEIGVNKIVPLHTERSDIGVRKKHKSQEKSVQKLDRWGRIGVEAAKQSRRSTVPILETFMTIEDFLVQSFSADVRLVLWEEEQQQQLKQVLRQQSDPVQSAIVVVGPEGGLTLKEAQSFTDAGYQSVSLGPRILRTETAGLVVLSILQYEFGDY